MSEQDQITAPEEIVVTARESKGPSLGDIIRVGGATILDPGGVVGQVIRNRRLEEAGDDLGGQSPTIGPFVRSAEAIGDGLNDRPSDAAVNPVLAEFNRASGFNILGFPVVNFTPIGGTVQTISSVVNSEETLKNAVGDFVVNAAESVPIIGEIAGPVAGLLRGNADVREVKRGIEFLDQNDVPGFRYDETRIDGHDVRIYVAAADSIANGGAQPWVRIEAEGIKKSDPRVQARAEAVLGQAQSDIYDFTTQQYDLAESQGVDENTISTADIQTALSNRIRDVVTGANVTQAPLQSGRIEANNGIVNGAVIIADTIKP